MSYVLDALRKSEHERQRASGQTSSILYPVMVEQNRMVWLWPAMLAGVILVVVVTVIIWWMGPRTPAANAANTAEKSAVTVAAPPPAIQTRELVTQKIPKRIISKPVSLATAPAKQFTAPPQKKSGIPAKTNEQPVPIATAVDKTEPSEDPLKGLPPLVISGYMHDEQVGSVAIINDKLVHEGEEVAPGLRLEKILGDGAIFNYKGYQFRR